MTRRPRSVRKAPVLMSVSDVACTDVRSRRQVVSVRAQGAAWLAPCSPLSPFPSYALHVTAEVANQTPSSHRAQSQCPAPRWHLRGRNLAVRQVNTTGPTPVGSPDSATDAGWCRTREGVAATACIAHRRMVITARISTVSVRSLRVRRRVGGRHGRPAVG